MTVFGLALPDSSQYRGLIARWPKKRREGLRLTVYFVAPDGTIDVD